MGYGS
jgi:hypothetical protein